MRWLPWPAPGQLAAILTGVLAAAAGPVVWNAILRATHASQFFTDPQGMTKLERMGVVATGPLQLLLTAASMVACINAIVGGMTVGLAVRSLADASVPVAAVTSAAVAVGLAALCFAYQVRRFHGAAAVVPELYEGPSPDMPGWPTA